MLSPKGSHLEKTMYLGDKQLYCIIWVTGISLAPCILGGSYLGADRSEVRTPVLSLSTPQISSFPAVMGTVREAFKSPERDLTGVRLVYGSLWLAVITRACTSLRRDLIAASRSGTLGSCLINNRWCCLSHLPSESHLGRTSLTPNPYLDIVSLILDMNNSEY